MRRLPRGCNVVTVVVVFVGGAGYGSRESGVVVDILVVVAIGSDVTVEEVFVGSCAAAAAGVAGWEEASGGGGLESHYCAARV
mmetsp:Transcript_17198/g.35838  ORF Transcript_17198/g.35838 Transcript_17198/m.35838 type:complete len:83 (+) Transcript_17198:1160-1408(+)